MENQLYKNLLRKMFSYSAKEFVFVNVFMYLQMNYFSPQHVLEKPSPHNI